MQPMYYIGLDVHKRKISYCVKDGSGRIHAEGSISATRLDLDHWMRSLPQPWSAAMEATMFTGWIYDHLQPHAAVLKVAHPLMLRAIAAAKKKNDRIDASKICDCLRCDFLPESYMASTAIRERRRTLRYRNLLVRQMVQMKIKISALLMEAGVSYNKQRLHKAGYFFANCWPPTRTSMKDCARSCDFAARQWCAWGKTRVPWQCSLCRRDSLLVRTYRAVDDHSSRRTDHGVDLGVGSGSIAAIFVDQKKPSATAGCAGAEKSSGGTVQRTPLSKQRNKHLQTTLIRRRRWPHAIVRNWPCCTTRKNRRVMPIARRWQWQESWWPT